MVAAQGIHRRLTGIIALCLATAIASAVAPSDLSAKSQQPKKHVEKHQMHSQPKKFTQHEARPEASRRFKISSSKISKLKKSSFWNRRPYQFASPVVDGDRIYVGADAGLFYAFDLNKNRKLWTFTAEGPIHSKAAILGDTVFTADAKGNVYALSTATGEKKWSQLLDTDILATPTVAGGRLYVATMSGRLYALDVLTGVEHWHTEAEEREFGFSVRRAAAPVVGSGMIYLGTSSGAIHAIRESDGNMVWSRQLGGIRNQVYDVDSTPLLLNGQLYAASVDGTLYRLDGASGRVVWTSDAGGSGDIAYNDGVLYCSGGSTLYAVDPETGFVKWQQDFETYGVSSPAVGEGFIAMASTTEKVYVVESSTGDIAYAPYLGKGSFGDPIVLTNSVYLLTNNGKLYSFKVRKVEPKESSERAQARRGHESGSIKSHKNDRQK